MGGLAGHTLLGLFFLFIGIWHLYNHAKLRFMNHQPHVHPLSIIWFPTPLLRHLELYLIMLACSVFTFTQLLHPPFDKDGSILTTHLPHLEHSAMAAAFFIYAVLAILLDRRARSRTNDDISHLLCASAFAQQLLLIHFHSTDHMGIEGRYHWLLQLVVSVSLLTTLMGIHWTSSRSSFRFILGYGRSLSVIFQGLWLLLMGVALWAPEFMAKGCFIHEEDRTVIRCRDEEATERAKALADLEFCWVLTGLMVFGVCFYTGMARVYRGQRPENQEPGDSERFIELPLKKGSRSGNSGIVEHIDRAA